MMKHTISPDIDDTFEVWDDWGYPNGIKVGDTLLFLFGTKHIAQIRAALDELEQRRADHRTPEDISATGPETAGFEQDAA